MWRVVLTGYSSTICLTRIMPNLISSGIIRCIYYSNFEIVLSIFLETLTKFSEKTAFVVILLNFYNYDFFFGIQCLKTSFLIYFEKIFRLVLWIYLNRNLMRWINKNKQFFKLLYRKTRAEKIGIFLLRKCQIFPHLIWFVKTREELREGLESEIAAFKQARELCGSALISWNHKEFKEQFFLNLPLIPMLK